MISGLLLRMRSPVQEVSLLLLAPVLLDAAKYLRWERDIPVTLSTNNINQVAYDSGPGNLPSDTVINVMVVADPLWTSSHGFDDLDSLEEALSQSFNSAESWYVKIKDYNFEEIPVNITDIDFGNQTTRIACVFMFV